MRLPDFIPLVSLEDALVKSFPMLQAGTLLACGGLFFCLVCVLLWEYIHAAKELDNLNEYTRTQDSVPSATNMIFIGMSKRKKFFQLLTVSTALRSLNLFLIFAIGPRDLDGKKDFYEGSLFWVREVLFVLPSLLYWSCFVYVSQFWISIYRMTSTKDSMVWPALLGSVQVSVYGGLLIWFLYCLIKEKQRLFASTMHIVLCVLYASIGIVAGYYGIRVASKFAPPNSPNENYKAESSVRAVVVIQKLLMVSLLAPLLWGLRAAMELLLGLSLNNYTSSIPLGTEIMYEGAVFLVTEFCPVILILRVFKRQKAITTKSDIRTPLL